jgi:hypothetical protein
LAEIEGMLRSGHPDVPGLCLALADWSAELQLILQSSNAREPQGGSIATSAICDQTNGLRNLAERPGKTKKAPGC